MDKAPSSPSGLPKASPVTPVCVLHTPGGSPAPSSHSWDSQSFPEPGWVRAAELWATQGWTPGFWDQLSGMPSGHILESVTVCLWVWACLGKRTKMSLTRVWFTGCPFVSLFCPRVCVCVCVCSLCQMWVCTLCLCLVT